MIDVELPRGPAAAALVRGFAACLASVTEVPVTELPLPDAAGARTGLAVTVGTCLALTWLIPHVYLDTVVLLGSMASTYGEHRWQFAVGSGVGSVVWFTGLGYGARLLRPVFARPAAWRVLDGGIAGVMAALAISLAVRGVAGA